MAGWKHVQFQPLKQSFSVVLFSGSVFLLVYELSLKLAMSWLVSRSWLPQGRNPWSHILTEQSSTKPVSGEKIEFRRHYAPLVEVWPCARHFFSLTISSVFENTGELVLWSAWVLALALWDDPEPSSLFLWLALGLAECTVTWWRKLLWLKTKPWEMFLIMLRSSHLNPGNGLKRQKGTAYICSTWWSSISVASSMHGTILIQFPRATSCPRNNVFGISSEVPGPCWHGD